MASALRWSRNRRLVPFRLDEPGLERVASDRAGGPRQVGRGEVHGEVAHGRSRAGVVGGRARRRPRRPRGRASHPAGGSAGLAGDGPPVRPHRRQRTAAHRLSRLQARRRVGSGAAQGMGRGDRARRKLGPIRSGLESRAVLGHPRGARGGPPAWRPPGLVGRHQGLRHRRGRGRAPLDRPGPRRAL